MRVIGLLPILLVTGMTSVSAVGAVGFMKLCLFLVGKDMTLGQADVMVLAPLFCFLVLMSYRLFIFIAPLKEGKIFPKTQQQFVYDVHILFYLLFFHPVLRSKILPVPLYNLLYKALGARLGENTFPAGLLLDPCFVSIGANGIIGDGSRFVPHVLEGNRLSHYKICVGDNVTVGMSSSILAGVVIEDRAIVAAHSVVTKNTHIREGEIWGGVPAIRIGHVDDRSKETKVVSDQGGTKWHLRESEKQASSF